ncbi:short-chain dehydrogenase reductase 3c-like isoform X2 [Cornus florida]|uniref:short-chain dehydrogenase reductase 3c-like isoform X2 n=1 Tax=Cornus florida TaxID=4283 RepID=UPI00289D1B02|nr:short-chain dehydrogenase reductase 3c-like isoform X2 [Cornus florida]
MLRVQLRRSISISRALFAESSFGRQFSTHNNSKLEGKVALITGGASGIGKETAIRFINNGAKVVITDVQQQLGQDTAKQLGSNASFITCNVSKETEVSDAVDYAVSKYGQLDIMFNNAGVTYNAPTSIVDLDFAEYDRVMAINLRGVMAGVKHASRVMIPRRTGSILCTASVTGMLGGLSPHTYSTSKSGVIGMVRSVASELCKHGIRINCISPWAIPTPAALESFTKSYPGVDAQRLPNIIESTGVLEGAFCESSDIANAAVFLASDDAKYISGHNLVVDGGFTAIKTLEIPAPEQVKT